MPRGYRLLCLVTTIVAVGIHPPTARAQPRVYVQVVDQRTGEFVHDLRPDQVMVREDGVVRPVLDVRPANLPIKLTVMVDNGGVAAPVFTRVREGLRVFFDRLPANQEMSLLTLAPRLEWVVRATLDQEAIRQGIDSMAGDSESPMRILDGIIAVNERVEADTEPHRPVIVIVSADGDDASIDRVAQNGPVMMRTLMRQTRQNGITVHMLLMTTPVAFQPRRSFQEAVGLDLTELTGGYFRSILVGSSLAERLVDIADAIRSRNRELSSQHVIVYERPEGEAPGDVRVILTRFGVRHRVTLDGRLP